MNRITKVVLGIISFQACLFASDIQSLIDSGAINTCFWGNGVLQLTYKGLKSLKGIENVPQASSVTVIDLSHNQISAFDGNLFKHFPKLIEINLNNNQITHLEELDALTNLRELHVTHNKLKELDFEQFSKLSMLYVLNVGYNDIRIIKPVKQGVLKNLEVLYLYNNRLVELPPYAFQAPNLQALYLQDNIITELQNDCFKGLCKLRLLYLHNNALPIVPSEIFSDLNNLHLLYLRNNAIKVLETDWCNGLDNLEILDLAWNKLNVNARTYGIGNLKKLRHFLY